MNKWLLFGCIVCHNLFADDYSEGRQFALNAQSGVVSGMSQINPAEYLKDFNANPPQAHLDPSRLQEEAKKAAAVDETAQHIITSHQQRENVTIDLNSEELKSAGQSIETADAQVNQNQIPCTDGHCLPTPDEDGNDLGEGVTQLGALSGAAGEVSSKQVRSGSASIFTGANVQCRITVADTGNCCGGEARFLNCRQEEKSLAYAIEDKRAQYVGEYCAHYKRVLGCLEYKQSWCVFPSKLASIIQIQGRLGQLGINFGWAHKRTNAPNCRGLTPEELERLNFQALNLSELTKEFEQRATPKSSGTIDAQSTQKIEQMEREGRAHD